MSKFKTKTKFVTLYEETGFKFESGEQLKKINVAYQTYGKLNLERTNVVYIFHALTGNSHAAGELEDLEYSPHDKYDWLNKYSKMNINKNGWWDSIIGVNKAIDTNKYFVVCANILGGCYGTTGPASFKPNSIDSYGSYFPVVTIRDMVKVHKALLNFLKVEQVYCGIGGSLGGMQALEFAIMFPDFIKKIVPIACSYRNSDWAIAFNELQRKAIFCDPNWNDGNYGDAVINNLGMARIAGLLSYRCSENYLEKFKNNNKNIISYSKNNKFAVTDYLNYQSEKFIRRFDPNSYVKLTYAMDLHDITFNRGNLKDVLESINAKTYSIAIDSDILYPAVEQEKFSKLIPNSEMYFIKSNFGHDAFLVEDQQLSLIINKVLYHYCNREE